MTEEKSVHILIEIKLLRFFKNTTVESHQNVIKTFLAEYMFGIKKQNPQQQINFSLPIPHFFPSLTHSAVWPFTHTLSLLGKWTLTFWSMIKRKKALINAKHCSNEHIFPFRARAAANVRASARSPTAELYRRKKGKAGLMGPYLLDFHHTENTKGRICDVKPTGGL